MRKFFKYCILIITVLYSYTSYSQWINEVHYDNDGGDVNECIEIMAPAGTDMSCYEIVLYNGSGGGQYGTITFSGIMADEECGYGIMSECFAGIQNGAPDGMALIDVCNSNDVIQFLSYEGSFTASDGPANGMTSTDIGVSESGSTGTDESMYLTGTGDDYSEYTWTTGTNSFGSINDGQTVEPCAGGSNTISLDDADNGSGGTDFTVECPSTAASGTVDFTSTGDFNTGNTFTAEFTSGTYLGELSLDGTDPGGTIAITIPADIPSGNYDIQIVSDDPFTTSNTFTITVTQNGACEPPHLTSVLINSCNDVCGEGNNEIVFGTSGDYEIEVTEENFNFSYSNTGSLSNYTDVLTNNGTTTQTLNDECASTDPFIDAYGGTIPEGATWMLVNDELCPEEALDWSGLCDSGPIYVVYTADPTWSLSGNFSNTTSDTRPYQTSITTTTGETFTIDYETDGSQYANSDGVFATFDADGGPATGYGDNDCMLDPILLGSNLVSFTTKKWNNYGQINWVVKEELDVSHYLLSHSSNGVDWLQIGRISGENNHNGRAKYSFLHKELSPGYNYYKLFSTDFDGTETYYGIRVLHSQINFAYYNKLSSSIELQENSNYLFYTVDGKLIGEIRNGSSYYLNDFSGMVIVKDSKNLLVQRVLVQ